MRDAKRNALQLINTVQPKAAPEQLPAPSFSQQPPKEKKPPQVPPERNIDNDAAYFLLSIISELEKSTQSAMNIQDFKPTNNSSIRN